VGPYQENPYLVIGPSGRRAVLVDPGLESEAVLEDARRDGLEIVMILNTHAHVDHVACNAFFKRETGAPLGIHPLDRPLLERMDLQAAVMGLTVHPSPVPDFDLREGEDLDLDGVPIRVLHTPGHTPGGVCLSFGEDALVGDTLFYRSVGRTDLPGGSWPDLVSSIREKLFALPDETRCWPGHGPDTSIGQERRANPFVSDVTG
jgi:glyoxylase-like metal-dependent hydrolase (beta-lactamase superfamily II)